MINIIIGILKLQPPKQTNKRSSEVERSAKYRMCVNTYTPSYLAVIKYILISH